VESSDAFYAFIAVFLLFMLFTWVMLPPPFNRMGRMFQRIGVAGYEITKAVGVTSDADICVLADLYNTGGILATVRDSTHEYNVSCALLTEKKVAIVPKDYEKFGSEVTAEATGQYWIKDIRTLNKLFYFSYLLMGLVIAEMITDMMVSTVGRKYSTAKVLGYGAVLTFGIMLVLIRTGAVWEVLNALMMLVPAKHSLIAMAITLVFMMAAWGWMIGQMVLGYEMAKSRKDRMKAMKIAAEADYLRGKTALEKARQLGR